MEHFRRNEDRAIRRAEQSIALNDLRLSFLSMGSSLNVLFSHNSSLGELPISKIENGSDTAGKGEIIDNLVFKVLESIEEDNNTNSSEQQATNGATSNSNNSTTVDNKEEQEQRQALKASLFWTNFLFPVFFFHAVATRMQFTYGSLYGRNGLCLNDSLAILAVGFTAMGRATAPPLLRRFFQTPYLFMILNATTLVGCAGMFLIPVIGGRNNFNDKGLLDNDEEQAGIGTILYFYLTMFIQGLAEVVSSWDSLILFEMRDWEPEEQQIAFRTSFVMIALGSSTAFLASSSLFQFYGLYGCAWFGVVIGVFNVVFPSLYMWFRWNEFDAWRKGGDKNRSEASRRSQPFMQLIKLDKLCEPSSELDTTSTRKLKLVDTTTVSNRTSNHNNSNNNMGSTSFSSLNGSDILRLSNESSKRDRSSRFISKRSSIYSRRKKFNRADSLIGASVSYGQPRNFIEFRTILQHQTCRRILKNFKTLQDSATEAVKERMSQLSKDDILAAFDPQLLLTHKKHIEWPKDFERQIIVLKWFCMLSLAIGSMMISSQFAVYALYLEDIFGFEPLYAGISMASGEVAGMVALLISIYLGKKRAVSLMVAEDDPSNGSSGIGASIRKDTNQKSINGWRKLLKSPTLLFQVPSMFVTCCAVAVLPLYMLGFLGSKDEDVKSSQISKILASISGAAVGIINCLMHSTTIEMAALLIPEDMFDGVVASGYSMRRITNLLVCLCATGLYSLDNHAVYITIASVYLLSVPISTYILVYYIKCMPWQKRNVVFESYDTADTLMMGASVRKSQLDTFAEIDEDKVEVDG